MADLSRFVSAHQHNYDTALSEIKNGRKRSHWMWYIFPQIEGLGYSDMAQFYAIRDMEEAKAFLAHPYLGQNLIEISQALLSLDENDPYRVMGYPDDLKLRSSMTLFAAAADEESVFGKVLDKYYNGEPDKTTLRILRL